MRKFFLAVCTLVALLAVALSFSACDAEELGSLEDLSKPYAGFYECEKLTLAGEDKSAAFDFVRLELGYGGEFNISYRTKKGNAGTLGGEYDADPEKEEITFRVKQGLRSVSRTFPFENGVIRVEESVLGKLLYAEFKME